VEFGIACENGGNAAERQEYLEGATSYGLKKAWLGKTFNYKDGKTYTIVGLKARSSKFPVVCINDAGQKMVFTSELITAYMTNPTNIEQALVEAQIKEMRKAYVWHGALGSLGLKEAWLDKTFKHNGHACTIVGLHEKGRHGNRETFVVVQDNEEKKKLYLAPIDAVVKAMGGKTKAAA